MKRRRKDAITDKRLEGSGYFAGQTDGAVQTRQHVTWWYRNIERTGFCLNGSVNHYPDFIIRTEAGKIILVETKGDDRDNSDSQRKVRLGRKWAECAGTDYKYYMVFDEKDTGFEGAYRLSEFLEIMKLM